MLAACGGSGISPTSNDQPENGEEPETLTNSVGGNLAPIADAGPNQTASASEPVTLDGRASSDPEGQPLNYRWTQISGAPELTLSSNTDAQPSFVAPSMPRDTSITFQLAVGDGVNYVKVDNVVILVLEDESIVVDESYTDTEYTLTQVISGGPWQFGQQASGMAVNGQDQVFLANGDTLWMIDGETISIYLGPDDGDFNFYDIDFDEAGLMYLLDGFQGDILTSSEAGSVDIYRQAGADRLTFSNFMGVADPSQVLITHRDGLSSVNGADALLVHGDTAFHGSTDCATEDIAVQRSGAFIYNPGCNGSPFVVGNTVDDAPRVFNLNGFGLEDGAPDCVTRDPAGGFFAVVDYFFENTQQLVHMDEEATESSGWQFALTSPSLDQVESQNEETFAFHYCAIAASSSGKIFYQTLSQLWVLTPRETQ